MKRIDIDTSISEKIRQYRILKNRTQEELGNSIGLPKQAISRIEKGERKVSYSELSKIAEFLEEPVESLIEEDIKNKLIRIGNSIASIPKFIFDSLTDYKKFLERGYSREEAKVITDEIRKQFRNVYENIYLDEHEIEHLEMERKENRELKNERDNLH